MTSSNTVDISSLTTNADITRRERGLLEKLDQLFSLSVPASTVDMDTPQDAKPPAPYISRATSSTVKYALFALCSVCIQFALHYISLISDTINNMFHDRSYIVKSICLFLLAFVSYKQIDRLF